MPGRVPNDFDIGFFHTGQTHKALLGIASDHTTHAAAGGGESHFHRDRASAGGKWDDFHVIDETEIDDVDGDLGVVTGFERFPNGLFIDWAIGRGFWSFGGSVVETERIRVLGRDTKKSALKRADGVAAAKGLGDVHLSSGGKRDHGTGRNFSGFTVALEFDGRSIVHGSNLPTSRD